MYEIVQALSEGKEGSVFNTLGDLMTEETIEIVYKLCKRGHVRSPENVNKDRKCKECRKAYEQSPARKEHKKEYKKAYDQSPARKEYKKAYDRSPSKKEYNKKYANLCADGYIAASLGIPVSQVPEDYLEIKRLTIQIQRSLKNGK